MNTPVSGPWSLTGESQIGLGDFVGRSEFIRIFCEAWSRRLLVLIVTLLFGVAGASFSLFATPWYRAQVSLLPAQGQSAQGLAGQLGALSGLAGLAGMSVGAGNRVEPLAILRSHDFLRRFIIKNRLEPELLPEKWDIGKRDWKVLSVGKTFDVRDAVDYFEKHVFRVGEDKKSGLVVLTVDWRDPVVAAAWANAISAEINELTRDQAISEASESINYLKAELAAAPQVALQQSISKLMESQLQTMMLARGRNEYSFKVIDRAEPPKYRFYPQRLLFALGSLALGGCLAICYVALFPRRRR